MDTHTSGFDQFTSSEHTQIIDDHLDVTISPDELRLLLGLAPVEQLADYGELAAIGMGGLGSIFAVREPGLNREIALKVLRPEYRNKLHHIERFIREARTTAQIDHPNIVPVHRIGVFDDIGVYFTMKRIEGETLRRIIQSLAERKPEYLRRYSLRRRLEIFISVCQGIAFAHSKGIIHCDLKPGNIMIGDYGEVFIMDWGLARYRQEKDQGVDGRKMALEFDGDFPESGNDGISGEKRREISGTPAYMAPEQAAGHSEGLDERLDIYGLGGILYALLTLEAAPYDVKLNTNELLGEVILGRMQRPRRRAPRQGIPRELEAITMKAMSRRRVNRYASVQLLIDDVRNFLDNYPVAAYSGPPFYRLFKLCRRRPLIPAALIVAVLTLGGVSLIRQISNYYQEDSLMGVVHDSLGQSEARYNLALRAYRLLQFDSGAASADALGRTENLRTNYREQTLEFFNRSNIALDALSSLEDRGIRNKSIRQYAGGIIKQQIQFLVATESDELLKPTIQRLRSRWRSTFEQILRLDPELATLVARVEQQEGVLSVDFPDGAAVAIRPLSSDNGAGPDEENWTELEEPGQARRIEAGSYLLKIEAAEAPPFYLPVIVGVAARRRVEIEPPPFFPAGTAFIHQGAFQYELGTGDGIGRKVLLPSFFISLHEVTVAEYRAFYRTLRGDEERRRFMPKFITPDNETVDLWDRDGKLIPPFTPELPVIGVTGGAAEAYCRYLSERTGYRCRLPSTMELQKAARGGDGRAYVWGNRFEPDAALVRENARAARFPAGAPPGSFPRDCSSYGVCDLAGNVREFVRNADDREALYTVMGGSRAISGLVHARTDSFGSAGFGENDIGFRYVVEIPLDDELGFSLQAADIPSAR